MADSWKQELEGSINGHMSTSILLLLSAETVFINELFPIVHKKHSIWMTCSLLNQLIREKR